MRWIIIVLLAVLLSQVAAAGCGSYANYFTDAGQPYWICGWGDCDEITVLGCCEFSEPDEFGHKTCIGGMTCQEIVDYAEPCDSEADIVYNSACGYAFDWSKGDVIDAIENAGIDEFVDNLECAGGKLSELDEDMLEEATDKIMEKYYVAGSMNMSQCAGENCSIDEDGVLTLIAGGQSATLNLTGLYVAPGTHITTIVDDNNPPPKFIFDIPENGYAEIEKDNGEIIYFASTIGASVEYTQEGNVKLPPGMTYAIQSSEGYNTSIDNAADGEEIIVYMDSMPYGAKGVGIGVNQVGEDGVIIKGVDVKVYHQTPEGSYGIITGNMSDTEEVSIIKTAGNHYISDFTLAGDTDIIITTGLQGISFNDGEMWACNPMTGSCPHDNESNLIIDVSWSGTILLDPEDPSSEVEEDFTVQMISQDRLSGTNFWTCDCDRKILCDEECSCDLTCSLQGSGEWTWVMFGYEKYYEFISNMNKTGGYMCEGDFECMGTRSYGGQLGKGYHLYENGKIADEIYRELSGMIIYRQDGTLLHDFCMNLVAFPSMNGHCMNSYDGGGNNCQTDCSEITDEEMQCNTCGIRCMSQTYEHSQIYCDFQVRGLNKTFILDDVSYVYDAEDPTKEYDCNNNAAKYIDFFCEKHCGYCNDFPYLNIPKSDLISDEVRIVLNRYVIDRYKESVNFELMYQSNPSVTCTIGLIIDERCSDDEEQFYEPWGLRCSGRGTTEIQIKAVDECGLNNYDDDLGTYQSFNVTIN